MLSIGSVRGGFRSLRLKLKAQPMESKGPEEPVRKI